MLKKLLMVMLVPVLVLGLMSCGEDIFDGDAIPYFLHGEWECDAGENFIAITGNQIVYNSAVYRVSYLSGPSEWTEDARITIEFFTWEGGFEAGNIVLDLLADRAAGFDIDRSNAIAPYHLPTALGNTWTPVN
jgi:hypothetical protein